MSKMKTMCNCGCGRVVKTKGRKYVAGHNPRQGKNILAFNEKKRFPSPERDRWLKGINRSIAKGKAHTTADYELIGKKVSIVQRAMGEDHFEAKEWRLISPYGDVYRFRNLHHFVRENPDLFNPDDVIWKGRSNRWCRATAGICSIRPNRKKPASEWKGWFWDFNDKEPVE